MPTFVQPTGNASIDGILWGWKWDTNNLTAAFPQSVNAYSQYNLVENFTPFSQFQATQIVDLVLNNLSVFSGLTITLTNNAAGANLRFAQASKLDYPDAFGPRIPGGIGSAEAVPPDPTEAPSYAHGDNWFTVGQYNEPILGSFQYAAGLLHELGHAIGLKHGHNPQTSNDGNGNTYNLPALPGNLNSQEFTIMTYASTTAGVTNVSEQEEYPWTYMMLDVQAIQHLYGANFGAGSNNGDTLYYFDEVSGVLQINENNTGYFPISAPYNGKILANMWDGGGNDSYVLTNHDQSQIIDMRPGGWLRFSDSQLSQLNLGQSGPAAFARGNISNSLLYQNDQRSLIENVYTGMGSDIIIGNQAANILHGGAGDDLLIGMRGADDLVGDTGTDTAAYSNSSQGITANMLNPGQNTGHAAGDRYFGVENLLGSSHNDKLGGDNNANEIIGLDGNDIINGYGGNDELIGGDGRDTLSGGSGQDNLVGGDKGDFLFGNLGRDFINPGAGTDAVNGGADFDRVWYGDSAAGVTVNLNTGVGSGGNAAGDTYVGVERVTGSAFQDTITGTSIANAIKGGGARDKIYGLDGRDILEGQDGNDSLFGGSSNDILLGGNNNDYLSGGRDNDTLDGGAGNDNLRGNLGKDMLDGKSGDDDLRGGGQNDSMFGKSGSDLLYGENGNDKLDGGTGNDVLNGGAGGDTFWYRDANYGFDRIKDWEDGTDQIDLTSFGFTNFNSQVFSLASNTSGGMRLDFGGGDVLFIEGFFRGNFDSGDVLI